MSIVGLYCIHLSARTEQDQTLLKKKKKTKGLHDSVFYNSVSQPPGHGTVPGPGINYTGPREILLELISNLNVILYLSTPSRAMYCVI